MATLNRPLTGFGWDQPADLSNKDVVKRLSPSAVKGFLKIASLLELRDEDACHVESETTSRRPSGWKVGASACFASPPGRHSSTDPISLRQRICPEQTDHRFR